MWCLVCTQPKLRPRQMLQYVDEGEQEVPAPGAAQAEPLDGPQAERQAERPGGPRDVRRDVRQGVLLDRRARGAHTSLEIR